MRLQLQPYRKMVLRQCKGRLDGVGEKVICYLDGKCNRFLSAESLPEKEQPSEPQDDTKEPSVPMV